MKKKMIMAIIGVSMILGMVGCKAKTTNKESVSKVEENQAEEEETEDSFEWIIDPAESEYIAISMEDDGLFFVAKENENEEHKEMWEYVYGVIDSTGKEIIPCLYHVKESSLKFQGDYILLCDEEENCFLYKRDGSLYMDVTKETGLTESMFSGYKLLDNGAIGFFGKDESYFYDENKNPISYDSFYDMAKESKNSVDMQSETASQVSDIESQIEVNIAYLKDECTEPCVFDNEEVCRAYNNAGGIILNGWTYNDVTKVPGYNENDYKDCKFWSPAVLPYIDAVNREIAVLAVDEGDGTVRMALGTDDGRIYSELKDYYYFDDVDRAGVSFFCNGRLLVHNSEYNSKPFRRFGVTEPTGMKGQYGYIDMCGKEVIPLKYEYASPFSEGLAYVYGDNMSGYIDVNGKEIIRFPESDYLGSQFVNGMATVYYPDWENDIYRAGLLKYDTGKFDSKQFMKEEYNKYKQKVDAK